MVTFYDPHGKSRQICSVENVIAERRNHILAHLNTPLNSVENLQNGFIKNGFEQTCKDIKIQAIYV